MSKGTAAARQAYLRAERAVDELFGDKSVSLEKALEELETLRDHIEICIEALESDREREAGKAEFDPWSYPDI